MLAVHKTPQKHKSRHVILIQRPQTWCGEGDLNPHGIAPASTSKHLTEFCRGSPGRKSLKLIEGCFAGLPRSSAGPLQNRCSLGVFLLPLFSASPFQSVIRDYARGGLAGY